MAELCGNALKTEAAEVDFLALLKNKKDLVIDLRPLRKAGADTSAALANLLKLHADVLNKSIFIGDKMDVETLLGAAPDFKDALMKNQSIASALA